MPRRRYGNPTDATAVPVAHDGPPHVRLAHRLLSSTERSNDDNDCPVNSLMLSLHDLRGLPLRRPSAVPCSMIFDSVS